MWNKTSFTALVGIDYPIVQGPFGGGLSSVALTAAVSNAGGLGSFGGQPYTATEIIDFGRKIRENTGKPFNLNLWVNDRDAALDAFDEQAYLQLTEIFRPYFEEMKIPLPARPADLGPRFDDQVEAIFALRPAVFSFVFGIPSSDILEQCRRLGIKTIGAATTADEAVALENAGVDAVVATGMEAGGHRVSFLKPVEESLTGTFALIPQVADRVKIPVIAAGGIADARGIKAALALGADAVQMGTAFLATAQSNASADHKLKLFSPEARYTSLTKVFTGRLSRGIHNRLIAEMKPHEHLLAPYPLQGAFMRMLKAYQATADTDPELKAYWAGQSAPLLRHRDVHELMKVLIRGMDT